MPLTHKTQDRIRVGLFRLTALSERYQGTTRRVTAAMIVPDIARTCEVAESGAYNVMRQAVSYGYVEYDTDITTGPNRGSKPFHITDLGIALLGNWHPLAVAEGTKARHADAEIAPPMPDPQES